MSSDNSGDDNGDGDRGGVTGNGTGSGSGSGDDEPQWRMIVVWWTSPRISLVIKRHLVLVYMLIIGLHFTRAGYVLYHHL